MYIGNVGQWRWGWVQKTFKHPELGWVKVMCAQLASKLIFGIWHLLSSCTTLSYCSTHTQQNRRKFPPQNDHVLFMQPHQRGLHFTSKRRKALLPECSYCMNVYHYMTLNLWLNLLIGYVLEIHWFTSYYLITF